MPKVEIKPLSVNQAWRGKRFKTDKYKRYERDLLFILPEIGLPKPPYQVYYRFGLSSKLADWDNGVKPFQDILQKRYGFDDRHIKRAIVEVDNVPKGSEYIFFEIKSLE